MASNSSSSGEKVTFGAVIEGPPAASQDRSVLTPTAASTPFYDLPSAQPSIQSLPDKKEPNTTVYETDVEAGRRSNANNLTPLASHSALDLPHAHPVASNVSGMSVFKKAKECTMWPTKETLMEKAKAQKAKEQKAKWGGSLKLKWDSFTKRQRMYIRALLLLLIVALAVGLGIGISKAVNGGVYAGKGQSHPIQDVS